MMIPGIPHGPVIPYGMPPAKDFLGMTWAEFFIRSFLVFMIGICIHAVWDKRNAYAALALPFFLLIFALLFLF